MKTRFFLFIGFLFSCFAFAQQVDCADNEKQFSQLINDKDFKKAYDFWQSNSVKCLALNEKNFKLAEELFQYNIDIAESENKEKAVREFINLYNIYDLNFPENKNGNFEKRAMILYDSKNGSDAEIYGFLEKAFNKQRDFFTNAQGIYTYFEMFYNKFKEGKSGISLDQMLTKYNEVKILANANSLKIQYKAVEYNNVIYSAESLMSDLLICKNLIPFFKNGFEANKTNVQWLENALSSLDKCKNDTFFEKLALELHQVKPSAMSTFYLGSYNLNQGKQDIAIDYFTKAIDLSTDKLEKAKNAYTIASILSLSDKSKANEMIKIAIENDATNGRYYIFLSNMYANSVQECGNAQEQQKAIYQLAINTIAKASQIELRLKPTVDKMTSDYMKAMGSFSNLKGKEVKVGCWINQSVQF